eukprot:gene31252-40620_t
MATITLSRAELEQIRASILPSVENKSFLDRKAELKKKSEDKLKNWPNTLEAIRLKKENDFLDRERQVELQRQEVDKQEAELRRQMRIESIQKANELIYDQTDKMKMLKSQKLYADVIATRYEQIDRKQIEREKQQIVEQSFHENILRQIEKGEADEKVKLEKVKARVDEVKITRKVQLEENRKRKEELERLSREEGQRLRQEAKDRYEQDLRSQELKHQKIIENNFATLKANQLLKTQKAEIEELENLKIAARDSEVAVIEKRKNDLKALEKARFEKSQEMRQTIIDRAILSLTNAGSKEATIMNKQALEIKEKADKEIADKEEKKRREWEETKVSRTAQIKRKEEEKRLEKEASDALARKFKADNEEGIRLEAEKQARAKEENTRIKLIQLEEGKLAQKKRMEDKLIEVEQDRFLASINKDNDEKFLEACKAEIERNVKLGKPVYTILRAMEYTAPALLAAKSKK